MARVDPVKKVYTSSFNWNNTTPKDTIIPIVNNDPALLKAAYPSLQNEFACNAYLTDLYMVERPYSLPSTDLPDYTDEDTRRDRTLKTSRMQWDSPSFHANFFITSKNFITNTSDWVFLGTIPIINTQGFKYIRHRPMDLFTHNLARPLGDGAKLGLQIETFQGYPLTSIDTIGIDCTWHQEALLIQPDFTPIYIEASTMVTSYSDKFTVSISRTNIEALPMRPSRRKLTILNNSTTGTLYLALGRAATELNNDLVIPPNQSKLILREDQVNLANSINLSSTVFGNSVTITEVYNGN